MFVQATKFVRRLRGGSQPFLALCDDGHHYIVKASGNPQGNNVLANELIGTVLARASGLPVAANAFVELSPSFLRHNPQICFESINTRARVDPGLHFGSRFIGDVAGPDRPIEFLSRADATRIENRSDFLGMFLFDVLTNHQDNRQAIFRRDPSTRSLHATFIDFGHLCGGPAWDRPGSRPLAYHLQTSIYSGLWSSRAVSSWVETFLNTFPQAISAVFPLIPSSWFHGNAALLEASLLTRLKSHHELTDARAFVCGPFSQGMPHEFLRVQDTPVRQL